LCAASGETRRLHMRSYFAMLAYMKEALATITRLYPGLSEEDRSIAAANLVRYLRVLLDFAEDICADPKRYEAFIALTAEAPPPTMDSDRSNMTSPNATQEV
jgi:hypothetical protein